MATNYKLNHKMQKCHTISEKKIHNSISAIPDTLSNSYPLCLWPFYIATLTPQLVL